MSHATSPSFHRPYGVGHRCDEHRDAGGGPCDRLRWRGSLYARRDRPPCRATGFEALEPIRQDVRRQFGACSAGIATGLQIRHDHGRQYMSNDFQAELRFLGMTSSPAFVCAPEGNGVAERFIRTLKEQLLWVRTFRTVEDLRVALQA